MGYFEIGVYHPRSSDNIGTLWRTAFQLGAAGIFTIGRPYRQQTSDTQHAAYEIPLRNYPSLDIFLANRPTGAVLVGVEMDGEQLSTFNHPERAIYLLGSEAMGLPAQVLQQCNAVIALEHIRYPSYNLAVAGSIVLYHRLFMASQSPQTKP
ncbi:MAG: RNA methyltransferase [Bellilinea sp.]